MSDAHGFRRAMLLVTTASALVPIIGLATAPILTQALGVLGRGEAATAMAPNTLIVSVATIGLPEALTFHLAKRPHKTWAALVWSSLLSAALGALCLIAVFLGTGFLSGGDAELSRLILLATVLSVPALFVNLLRGAAAGRQLWASVAVERIVNSLLKLVAFVALALAGKLDVTAAVLVMGLSPVVAGLAYLPLLRRPPARPIEERDDLRFRSILDFGLKIWLGAVASMLMARLSQLLVTPLSDAAELGLLVVAITISDVPYIVTQTVRDVIFGADSERADPVRLASTSRITTLIALTGSVVLGSTLPLWIAPLFGDGFDAAVVPTWFLLAASVVGVPGLIAGAGLASAGRPGLRSTALVVALVVNLVGLVVLTPPLGALGAALAGLLSTLLSTAFALWQVRRLLGVAIAPFLVPRRADVRFLGHELKRILRRLFRRR